MLSFEKVYKSYPGPEGRVDVLRGIDLSLNQGDLAVVRGPSGCGKSTLLFTAGTMLPPERGRVTFGGMSVYDAPRFRRNSVRGTSVGFIFQRFHLIPYLNVEENILWPLRWSRKDASELKKNLPGLAGRLGIRKRFAHLPCQLSTGEQQRVAVARALLGGKKLICADEPTGNLDDENAALVVEVLKDEASKGSVVLLVTHQRELSGLGNVYLEFNGGGKLEASTPAPPACGKQREP